jgi:hypothetical protein
MSSERTWDSDLGFLLYSVGLTQVEIGKRLDIDPSTVSRVCTTERWDDKLEVVLRERAVLLGPKASKEQEFIRTQECAVARQLLGIGHQMIREFNSDMWKLSKTPIADMVKVLELASRLGRMGSGLPLNQVEVTVTHDLNEELRAALARAYPEETKSLPEPQKVIDLSKDPQ